MMKTLRVPLETTAYDIHIGSGLLPRAGELIRPVLKRPRVFIVTDATVAGHYLETLQASLEAQSIAHDSHVVAPGEGSKSFPTLEALLDSLLRHRVERSTTILALGGGVVGDLAGFAASIVLRGVDFIQIPTTLLSQVDSSVGGKTGINTVRGKNLVGSFHQPRLVLTDTATLDTLPVRERRAGYAEIVKMAVIRDAAFFDWLEANGRAVLEGGAQERASAIATACAHKAAIVAADEREAGERALLNLGHTFGHALEAETGYGEVLLHGEAVALGMIMAVSLSVRMGLCPASDLARLRAHLDDVGLITRLSEVPLTGGWSAERLFAHMAHDKKMDAGTITFVLAEGIGKGVLRRDVDPAAVMAVLEEAVLA
ncbi:3-dehydroquinate synthase [Phaeovibrio sulfidiphilus]|uniref:3-dehydroquinate synthase n=1 Tax=Phaeovibrio sulfidiphilus TaxID=1220600 RepID=A0A8J7CQC3_9PROT|nr:3-dehydroquinate synthase [Phaeovibrio sulfidiphilus]MBE1236675.1 3-dehydroquinate synthase [Phaeovibrio sulfidiphilus]